MKKSQTASHALSHYCQYAQVLARGSGVDSQKLDPSGPAPVGLALLLLSHDGPWERERHTMDRSRGVTRHRLCKCGTNTATRKKEIEKGAPLATMCGHQSRACADTSPRNRAFVHFVRPAVRSESSAAATTAEATLGGRPSNGIVAHDTAGAQLPWGADRRLCHMPGIARLSRSLLPWHRVHGLGPCGPALLSHS